MSNKALLIILDGWGLSGETTGNAPLLAKTPTLDFVYQNFPKTSLTASGLEVGLSAGEPGNSEVGHMNIGSGRVMWENLPRIDQSIEKGEFFKNEVLLKTFNYVKKNDSTLHLIGLVSDGGVHSHIRHLFALIEAAKNSGVKKVLIHFIADGRDTAPKAAENYIRQIESVIKKFGVGKIATMIGRYYAMDRDKNWDRQKKAFDLLMENAGKNYLDADTAIKANYDNGKSDEDMEPSTIGDGGRISANDGVILYNFRSDRARQLLSLFFGAQGVKVPANLSIISMTEYEKGQKAEILFAPLSAENTLSDLVSKKGLKQFHTAETEKYAHVTYFFKAGKEKLLPGEKDEVVPSKKSPAYDKIPEMSAPEVSEKVKMAIQNEYDFVVVNYANGDMVGHTGVLESAVLACEAVDKCLLDVLKEASFKKYKVIITADHGNCDQMIDDLTKQPNKEHTTNPVPFVFLDFEKKPFDFKETALNKEDYIQYAVGTPIGVLADVAPSVLANMGIPKSKEMTGMDLTVAML